ncbi:MAG: phage tail tape measure protein [Bilophila wadsworthia]
MFAGLGVSVGFGQAIRQAAAFETALVSMRRVTSRSASELKADIAGLGPELGSQTQLMQGLYTVYSSGVTEAAKAVDLLTTASKASKVSGVSQAQAVDALTSLMTGYTGELNRAAEASDLLFAIEKQGKTTVGEVIPVIGELASVSKQAGISADEMGAQFSALTLTSGGTAKAATQYKAAVMELLRPNEKLAGLIGRLGYESGTAMVKQNGLARTWRMLDAAARQSGSSLAQFLSSEESLVGLAPQLETAFAQHAANLDAMNKKTGETDASFARWKERLNGLKDTTANMLDNLGTQGGNLFAPAAAEGLRQLNDVLKLLSDNFDTVASGAVVLSSGLPE